MDRNKFNKPIQALDSLAKDTEDEKHFGLAVYNKKLSKTLMVYGSSLNDNGYKKFNMLVYDTGSTKKPLDTLNTLYLAKEEPLKPIATATVSEYGPNLSIENIYVGKTYRRNGIAKMICGISEDIACAGKYSTLFATQHDLGNYNEEERYIRENFSDVSTARRIVEKLTNYNSEGKRMEINNKMLSLCGFYVDAKNPYHFPRKYELEPQGYLLDKDYGLAIDSISQSDSHDIYGLNVDRFVKSIKEDKQKNREKTDIETMDKE